MRRSVPEGTRWIPACAGMTEKWNGHHLNRRHSTRSGSWFFPAAALGAFLNQPFTNFRHSRERGNPETYIPARSAASLKFLVLRIGKNEPDSRVRGNGEVIVL
jgi:hypothetical protein